MDLERALIAWRRAASQADQLCGVLCRADLRDQGFQSRTCQHQINQAEQRADQDQGHKAEAPIGPKSGDYERNVSNSQHHHDQYVDDLDDRRSNESLEIEIKQGFH